MLYIHQSRSPLRAVQDIDQLRLVESPVGTKPNGLWFSVGDGSDWRDLFPMKGWSVEDAKCQTEVVFADCANILRAGSAKDVDDLTYEYGKDGGQAIDWSRIAEKFDGIIIAPHCVERSDHQQTRWYKCWAVSCGCVWRARAVEFLRPLNY
jgi:hypothetical protein